MSGDLPEGWSITRLGDVSRTFAGGTPSRSNRAYYGTGIPWLKSGEVRAGRIERTEEQITELGLRESSARVARAGTPVLAMYGGGTVGLAGILSIDAAINQAVLAIEPDGSRLDREFCYYLLCSANKRLLGLIQGSGQANLSKAIVDGLQVALPPLDEQRRIAEVLRSVNEALRTADAARGAANSVFRASLEEMLDGVAFDWPTWRLGQVAEFINGRGFKPHEWESTGLPIIRIQNLNGGTEFNFYSGPYNPKIRVSTGELLFAWSGSRGTSFGPHIWQGPEGLLNYHTWKVVPTSKSDAQFLYFSLLRLTKQIEEEAHGASALVHTQKATIVDYETGWPSSEVRMEVASTLSEMEDARSAANVAFEQARAVRQQMASDLLSGRVRVPA